MKHWLIPLAIGSFAGAVVGHYHNLDRPQIVLNPEPTPYELALQVREAKVMQHFIPGGCEDPSKEGYDSENKVLIMCTSAATSPKQFTVEEQLRFRGYAAEALQDAPNR